MKLVILTVLVVLAVSQSEALQCYCGGSRRCPSSVETCSGSDSVCISAILNTGSSVTHFRGCYRSRDCASLSRLPGATVRCCGTDLCNR